MMRLGASCGKAKCCFVPAMLATAVTGSRHAWSKILVTSKRGEGAHYLTTGSRRYRWRTFDDRRWTTVGFIASLIETCKINDVDPLAYLTDVLKRIVNQQRFAGLCISHNPLRGVATGGAGAKIALQLHRGLVARLHPER
jgi:IS66 C-terminal element